MTNKMINKMIFSFDVEKLYNILYAVGALSYGAGAIIDAKEYKKRYKNEQDDSFSFLSDALFGTGVVMIEMGSESLLEALVRSLKLRK